MTLTIEVASKVTSSHLERDAYVYVRQSTLTQVRQHTESLERQYELASRAQVLGWAPRNVVVVDEDLGRSGAESSAREGFKNLVADVGLGKVGIVLGIEVSRLARNNADWYHLLDLCALTDTLIGDGDGLYHPADFNDRLVLGLSGCLVDNQVIVAGQIVGDMSVTTRLAWSVRDSTRTPCSLLIDRSRHRGVGGAESTAVHGPLPAEP